MKENNNFELINTIEWGFPDGSEVKASACNAGDLGLIPGSGRSPGEGNGNPLQYSCLENPMDRGAWWPTVHRVTKSRTWLSDFTHGLLQGTNSPCSFKFLMMGFKPSLSSGFSGYCFLCGNKCGSLSLTTTGIAFCAWSTDFPSAHTLGFTFCSTKGGEKKGSIFMKTEAWTLFSISLPKRGEGDSGTIRNSCENSTEF